MLDDVLRLGPIRGRVDPDLVVLVCGEQLGAVHRVEVGCDGAGDAAVNGWRIHSAVLALRRQPTHPNTKEGGGIERMQQTTKVCRLTRVDTFLVRELVQEAVLVLDVSQVPEFNRVVDGGGCQQPITAGIELGVRHFAFVQLVAENLHRPTRRNPLNLETRKS